jgi:hypothetical protein
MLTHMKTIVPFLVVLIAATRLSAAEDVKLPDPLVMNDGSKVTSAEMWQTKRRGEILELFRENVYGRAPVGRPENLSFAITNSAADAMDGKATRKLVRISYAGPGGEGGINLILFVPNSAKKPVPCFLLICNRGRENIDPMRVQKSPFWPAEQIVARGYAAAAFWNGDVTPDRKDSFTNGVHAIFDPPSGRRGDSWGTLAAWAWGASRCLDYLETDQDIDAKRVAVIGHSRGGKTALWAGTEDERFAMAGSNDSGCSGAGLARIRNPKAETIKDIMKTFPYWFCSNYRKYIDHEDDLPVDQHELAALIAPRLLYIASASEDVWADPDREFLCAIKATPVFEIFGLKGISSQPTPAPEHPISDGNIGHHIRAGKHDLTEYDWACYMDFADKHLRAK